jgi:hypothetical protein
MFASLTLLITCLAVATSVPQTIVTPAPQPIVASRTGPQADLTPDETEDLQAEIDTPVAPESPKEWKKRMVRPCTRVGNRVTC